MSAAERRRGLWAAAATLAVAGGLAAALVHLGAPAERRLRRLDEERTNRLQALSRDANAYFDREGHLPPTLDEMRSQPWAKPVTRDPESERPFVYEPLGERRYRLCADFARPSPAPPLDREDDFWAHPQGHHCYEIAVPPPKPASGPSRFPGL